MTLKDLVSKLDIVAVLGFLIAIETQITNGSMSFAHSLPEAWIPVVKEWAGNLASIGGLLVGVIRMSGNSANVASAVVKMLIAAVVLSFFLAGAPALAEGGKLKTPNQVKEDVTEFFNQPATTVENALQGALSKPMQDLQSFLQSDLEGAAALAVQMPSVQDGNGQACWTMLQGASAVFKAHPIPLTLKVATDIEAARLLVMTANKICQNSQCTQVFNELSNSIKTIAPMSLAVPSITSLCSQVPQIAQVAAMPVPAPTPTPAATVTPTPISTPTPEATPTK